MSTHQNLLESELSDMIGLCLKGNSIAQEKLYKTFFPKMMALVKRYTEDHDTAVDILNNGFLRVFQKLDTFQFQGSFEGWVRRIIVHAVSDYFRKKPSMKVFYPETCPEIAGLPEVLEKYDFSDLLALLYQLPQTTRIVCNLSIIEGYPYSEIASLLNLKEVTCRWHVTEGKKILRSIVNKSNSLKPHNEG